VFARVTELNLPFRDHLFLAVAIKNNGRGRSLSRDVKMLEELEGIVRSLQAVVHDQGKGEFAVVFQGESEQALRQQAFEALAEFLAFCRDSAETTAFAGIGGATERLHELGKSYHEAEIGCNYAVFSGAAAPVFFTDIKGGGGDPGLHLAERLEKAKELFQKGEPADAREYARGIRLAAGEVGSGNMGLQYAYIDILMTAGRFLKSMQVEAESVLPELASLAENAFGISRPEVLESGIADICGRVVGYRKKHLAGRYHELLNRAKEYIAANFMDPELSLQAVAMHVHVSPSHFSAIFSRENGETFSDYLARVRMDNAARLLKTTSMSAAEISRQVGYNDPQYFSRVFKRASGVSIRTFRAGK
jgi:two-component system response regulator YesN